MFDVHYAAHSYFWNHKQNTSDNTSRDTSNHKRAQIVYMLATRDASAMLHDLSRTFSLDVLYLNDTMRSPIYSVPVPLVVQSSCHNIMTLYSSLPS